MSKNLIIGQSGGPTAVINSSLAGAIDYALGCDEIGSVYGMINGIEGFLDENIMNLSNMFEHMPYELNRLKLTPAMFLGSCRYKLSGNEEELAKVVSIMQKYDIGYFIYIGGNDSMDTVKKLSDYTTSHAIDIKIVGVPKTIYKHLQHQKRAHYRGYGQKRRLADRRIMSCKARRYGGTAPYLSAGG